LLCSTLPPRTGVQPVGENETVTLRKRLNQGRLLRDPQNSERLIDSSGHSVMLIEEAHMVVSDHDKSFSDLLTFRVSPPKPRSYFINANGLSGAAARRAAVQARWDRRRLERVVRPMPLSGFDTILGLPMGESAVMVGMGSQGMTTMSGYLQSDTEPTPFDHTDPHWMRTWMRVQRLKAIARRLRVDEPDPQEHGVAWTEEKIATWERAIDRRRLNVLAASRPKPKTVGKRRM
jgi:hypothetical protein